MSNHSKLALSIIIGLGAYLLATSAFYPVPSLSVFDAKRILQLGLFAAVISLTVAWGPLRNATLARLAGVPRWASLLTALFFLLGIVSALRLDHPSYALADVALMFVLLMLVAVVASSRDISTERFDRWFIVLTAALGLAVFVQELMGFAANWAMGSEFNYTEALVHFAHPRFYNQLQTWSIPLLAGLPLLFPGKRWLRWACVILLGFQWFLVLATAARGTFVSLAIAMAFLAFWSPGQRKSWLWYQLAGVLAGLVLYLGILQLNSVLLPSSEPGAFYAHSSAGRPMLHTSGRSTLWRLSLEDAVQHPILGSGPTRYACDSDIVLPAHPHSFPLRIMGEWGFVALALLLALALGIGRGLLRALKKLSEGASTGPPLAVMLATGLAAGLVHACLSGLLIMPASQVMMALVAGSAWSLAGSGPRPVRIPVFPRMVLAVSLLGAGALLSFGLIELPRLTERTVYSVDYGPAVPRFWQDGRVCEYNFTTSTGVR